MIQTFSVKTTPINVKQSFCALQLQFDANSQNIHITAKLQLAPYLV